VGRNVKHDSHDPQGKGPPTGDYDALEGFKLPADIMVQYEAKKKKGSKSQ
jgi:hypothetical protein